MLSTFEKCSDRGVSYQLGLIIFNIGLGSGLTKLGTIVGANLPGLCAGHALGAHACEYVDATYLGVCRHLSSTDTPDSCLRQNLRSGRLAFVHAGSRHGAGVCLCLGPGIRCDAGGAGALYPCHYCRKADSWPPVQAAGAGACHAYVSYAHLGMYVRELDTLATRACTTRQRTTHTHTHVQVVMSVALGVGTGTAVGLLKVCCSCSQWQSVIRLLHFIILCVTGACYLCITFHFFCM